jgi:hypothetical protein
MDSSFFWGHAIEARFITNNFHQVMKVHLKCDQKENKTAGVAKYRSCRSGFCANKRSMLLYNTSP